MYFFFSSLLLIKLPPFYLFPFISTSKILTTHVIAKLIFTAVFMQSIMKNRARFLEISKKYQNIFLLLSFFFITQSLSILRAKDINLFIITYSNIITFLLVFTISFFYSKTSKQFNKRVTNFFYITLTIAIAVEILFFFSMYFFRQSLWFVQREVVDAYLTDINRARFWFVLNNELFIPFIIVFILFSKKKVGVNLNILMLIILVSLATLSNVRTRFLQTIFSVFLPFFIFTQEQKKNLFKVFLLIIGTIIISLYTSKVINSINMITRFVISDPNNSSTILARNDFAKISINYIKVSPIFGLGLGNYVNTDILKRKFFLNYDMPYIKNYHLAVANSPHNIFFEIASETGLLGLSSFLSLIIYFAFNDVKTIKLRKKPLVISFIISSWTIFLYTLFNPYKTIYIFGWFWFMRGIIEANKYKCSINYQ